MDYPLLQTIDSPKDLKELERHELTQLADELRSYVIEVIDTVGGHMAPTLGVIELTIALHYVLNTPEDKLVWDVGHQAYAHKVLTGRREDLRTIRQYKGLAPFCKPDESEYDAFGAGHASTSISAALGIATARDLQNRDFRVAAIIGDGAITGGLAYEGLNNVGSSGRQMVVILNDNEMSISPNVGAIHHYLTKVVTNPLYNKIRDELWNLTGKLPRKRHIRYVGKKMEEGLKNFLTPGMLFEDIGFRYFGPIDGHNMAEVVETLESLKDINTPVLLHVLTEKGKGYPDVEKSPVRFHSVKGKQAVKRAKLQTLPNFSNIFGTTAVELAEKHADVVAITPAMREGSDLVQFSGQFPERYFDVGIAEGHAVTFSAGMAIQGMRPVTAIYSSFLQRGYDNIIHDVALQKLPVTFCLDRSGLVGGDGPTHHGAYDFSYMLHIPDLIISAPKDGNELRNLMHTAYGYTEGPFSIRYPKGSCLAFDKTLKASKLKIGSWERLRTGEDVVVLAAGSIVYSVEEALSALEKEGFRIGLVNARFIKPFDKQMLSKLVKEYEHIVTVEENSVVGGFGSVIENYIHEDLDAANKVTRIGIPDKFFEHGSREQILHDAGLSAERLKERLREINKSRHQISAEVS